MNNFLRKSIEQVSESIISDHIKDEYEEDFEIDESKGGFGGNNNGFNQTKQKPLAGLSGFGGRNATSNNDESSGGFEEKDDDEDYF